VLAFQILVYIGIGGIIIWIAWLILKRPDELTAFAQNSLGWVIFVFLSVMLYFMTA
jgi:hypothetical protein